VDYLKKELSIVLDKDTFALAFNDDFKKNDLGIEILKNSLILQPDESLINSDLISM